MDLRVIFIFLDADGARQDEKDKKRRKDTLPGVIALVHRWYRTWYQNGHLQDKIPVSDR